VTNLFFALSVLLTITLRIGSLPWRWIKRFSLVLLLAAAVAMATFPFAPRWQRGSFELNVLDVGQGDSLLLVFPAGHTILVDASGSFSDPAHRSEMRGPDPGEEVVSRYLWSRGLKHIDVVALTPAHQDHMAALPQREQLEKLVTAHGAQVIHELRSDVLAIAQHGSKNSTTPDFPAAVQPCLALISSGEQSSYGHPNPQLLEPLSGAAVPTLRTDSNGAIHILSNGKMLEVSCFVACSQVAAQVNSSQPQTPQDQQRSQQQ
jgi:beta-lactamase superfamily II metal-dependent hydrolase